MKQFCIAFTFLFLFACGQKNTNQWTTIEVGNYLLDFPPDFKLYKEKGIDSYVGKIKGDSISFNFDFGYYSHDFGYTLQEYLDSEEWRQALSYRFMKNGITYHDKNMPKVDVMNVLPATSKDSTLGKGCDYVAKCKYEEVTFDFPIYIPKKIKETNISIDTVHNQYRKTVWSKYSSKGVTGIYIRDLKGFEPSMNSYLALSMTTTNLTKTQQEIALKIFKTARHKSGSK